MKLKGVEQVLRAIANEYVIAVEGNNLVARDPSRTRHDPRGENISMMRNKPGNREKSEFRPPGVTHSAPLGRRSFLQIPPPLWVSLKWAGSERFL